MDDDPDEITDPVEDDSNSNSAFDGWGDPLDDQGAVGGAWPIGVGWGPGGAPGLSILFISNKEWRIQGFP